jgi:hypothetical protein
MAGLIWIAEAVLLGCLLIHRLTDLRSIEPVWARLLLSVGAGAAGGVGLTSCLFFLCGPLLGIPSAAIALELTALAWMGYEFFRRRAPRNKSAAIVRSPLLLPLAAALLLAVGIATAAMVTAWDANPHGNWDAWSIWNLRARFLESGVGLATRTWSQALGANTHVEYPLLLSSFVARCWSFARSSATAVPAATSYVFFLALIALVTGGMAALRGETLGVLAGLTLTASPTLLREVPAQYADVPLACYLAGAIVLALLDRGVLAGIFAGFAAWTKDEGLLFLVLFLAAIAIFRPRALRASISGALLPAALVGCFKALLVRGNSSLLSTSLPGALHRIFDAARYGTVLAAFGREFLNMGVGWYHPILPLLALAIALGFDGKRRKDVLFCSAILAGLLLGDFGVYLITVNDLNWQLQTSLNRILLQIWPTLFLAAFVGLRTPDISSVPQPALPAKTRRKAKR